MAPAQPCNVAADNSWRQAVRKEERLRWSHDANATLRNRTLLGRIGERSLAKASEVPEQAAPQPPQPSTASSTNTSFSHGRRSAAIGFLEEKVGGARASYGRCGTSELLHQDSSSAGCGRVEYLRRRRKYGVAERYGHPVTEAQTYDLGMHGENQPQAPAHARRAVIEHSFFRKMGVAQSQA
eukprot:TRINITY_DN111478_c0_g1_i1.p1 TRINITY_DN111478_c0_g1~~TRINITY_DN111478_c0_g1_i1.p1  ORF type:complete len:182 (-),score=32.69 TRINITY_DN111478_c0_g1_i1:56-601(-)